MSDDRTGSRSRPHWIVWLFAGVGLLGLGAIIVIAWAILGIEGSGREPARVAGPTPEASFAVRDAQPLAGTPFIRIEISAGAGRHGSSLVSSGSSSELRNILLMDRRNGAVRPLLPGNDRRIEQVNFLPAEADSAPTEGGRSRPEEEDHPPAYFVLLVGPVEGTDARATGARLDQGFDLLVGRLGDDGQAFVMRGLDGVDAIWMQSPSRIGLIVREELNLHYRIVDMTSLRVIGSRRIAI